MAVSYRTKGLVFKKSDRHESDRIFTVFTYDFGRLEIFGKAIRKIESKLKSGIDIFSLSEIEFIQGKSRKTLTDALAINKFSNLLLDLEKFKISQNIGAILDSLINGQEKDEKIWELLIAAFEKLNDPLLPQKKYKLVYYYFFWNFISMLGYGPQVFKCSCCGAKLNPYSLYFSNKDGGVVCRNCSFLAPGAVKINSDAVKIIRLILAGNWQVLSRLKTENAAAGFLDEISENYRRHVLSGHSSGFKKI